MTCRDNSLTPGPRRHGPTPGADGDREASFTTAVPERIDADAILHAYVQSYKFEGAHRNQAPRSESERQIMKRVQEQFREYIFGCEVQGGGEVSGVFIHHPRVRAHHGKEIFTFLAEVRDRSAQSLIPFGDRLFRNEEGLVTTQVIGNRDAKEPLRFVPLYSARAFQAELGRLTEGNYWAPGGYLRARVHDHLIERLAQLSAVRNEFWGPNSIVGESGAALCFSTDRGSIDIGLRRDEKTCRVQVQSRVRVIPPHEA